MKAKSILEARHLSFAYPGGKDLFQDIDLTLDGSVLTLLTGDNGCGKSTLLRLLSGGLKPRLENILWNGETLDSMSGSLYRQLWHLDQETKRQRIGICPKHDLEIWQMALAQQAIDFPITASAQSFLLDPHKLERPYQQLSKGEAKAAALTPLPYIMQRYWLLDEPLDSLDSSRAQILIDLCAKKIEQGNGLLIVTHNPEAYQALPHRRMELASGKIKELL